jgi:hypothetical protein
LAILRGREVAAWEVKGDVVDVDVAATVYDNLVPRVIAHIGQIDMRHDRAV